LCPPTGLVPQVFSVPAHNKKIDKLKPGKNLLQEEARMRYRDPSWWQVGALYVIAATAFIPPESTRRIVVGVVMFAVVTAAVAVKIFRARSANKKSSASPGP
jgi:hypothetical protein